jgi:hypothetical protein
LFCTLTCTHTYIRTHTYTHTHTHTHATNQHDLLHICDTSPAFPHAQFPPLIQVSTQFSLFSFNWLFFSFFFFFFLATHRASFFFSFFLPFLTCLCCSLSRLSFSPPLLSSLPSFLPPCTVSLFRPFYLSLAHAVGRSPGVIRNILPWSCTRQTSGALHCHFFESSYHLLRLSDCNHKNREQCCCRPFLS